MLATSIITDSNAFFPSALARQHPPIVIPHRVRILDEAIEDTALGADEMFARLAVADRTFSRIRPAMLPPRADAVERALATAVARSREVVAVHMSRHLSPMFQTVETAAQYLDGVAIRVLDSHSVSMGLGWLVEQALQASARGGRMMQVSRAVTGNRPSLFVTFFAESMHYLEQSAGLAASQSVLGSLLNIKAMLSMEDGILMPVEKVQTRTELVERLFEYLVEFSCIRWLGILHHAYDTAVHALKMKLREHDPDLVVVDLPYPLSLAVHLGPNVIGVIVHEDTL